MSSRARRRAGEARTTVSEAVSLRLGAKPTVRPNDHSNRAVIQSICTGPGHLDPEIANGHGIDAQRLRQQLRPECADEPKA